MAKKLLNDQTSRKTHFFHTELQSLLDDLKSTLYSLDSLRGKKLIEQFIHPPPSLNFELHGRGVYFVSNQCNLNCTYCKGLASCIVPPDLDEFENIIHQWHDRKLQYIHLTGLEPTEAQCIVKYLNIARKYQLKVSMSTNGYQAFQLYLELVKQGLKYISISLDAHNEIVTRKMGRQDNIYAKVSANIKKLIALKQEYDITVVICLAVTKVNFSLLPEIVADFIQDLHPDDIRLIPVAQEIFTEEDREYYHQTIQPQLLKLAPAKYPFLLYRINNFFHVRGLQTTPVEKCYVVLDERTVGGKDIYPCNIYIRERGDPITSISDHNQNEKIWRWFLHHNCMDDPICVNYCCDVTREYNLMVENYVKFLIQQHVFQPQETLESILQEEPIEKTFQQFQSDSLVKLDTHLKRTALNAGYLGMSLNWHFLTIYYLMRSALLHDIGKSHSDLRRLNFEHKLNPQNKDLARKHIFYGKDILDHIGYHVEGNIALQHHERIDGSGYQHIKINWPMAELVGLSDAYSALTEDRSGRYKFSPSESVSMITAGECGPFRGVYLKALRNCYEHNLLC